MTEQTTKQKIDFAREGHGAGFEGVPVESVEIEQKEDSDSIPF